jgi:hypothetical protein
LSLNGLGGNPMCNKLKKKSFCKWGKSDIKKNVISIYDLTAKPKYLCEKCARVAKVKANVCKPYQFKKARA